MRRLIRTRLREVLTLLDDDTVRAVQRLGDALALRTWDLAMALLDVGDVAKAVLDERVAIRSTWREAVAGSPVRRGQAVTMGSDGRVYPASPSVEAWERDALTGYPVGIGPRGEA